MAKKQNGETLKQNGERIVERKVKILKKLNIAISPNLMIQTALFSLFFTLQILLKC
jgi:hypothetical protein